MIIDAHVQFWKYYKSDAWITRDMEILQQDYLPDHFSLTAKRNEIKGVVAVQSNRSDQNEVNTHFLVELSKTHPLIKGVIGWVDLGSKTVNEKLYFFSQYPVIKGWCHNLQNIPDKFLSEENFHTISRFQTLNNYTFDLLIDHSQLATIVQLFSRFPQLKCVVDHCAKPDIKHKNIDEWRFLIGEIAKNPNAYCKVSGLFTEATWKQWSPGDFYPYLDVVFDAFGTDRLMYASDWPVILLSGMYVQWKSLLEKYMENFQGKEVEKVFGLNAVGFYGL